MEVTMSLSGISVPLPKNTLFDNCAENTSLIKLICANLKKTGMIHSEKLSCMNIFITFFTTIMIGI
jgi:hypothetical protein